MRSTDNDVVADTVNDDSSIVLKDVCAVVVDALSSPRNADEATRSGSVGVMKIFLNLGLNKSG